MLNWQARICPLDFEAVFVKKGRPGSESHYHARRTTITRWLEECGKARLIELRAVHVAKLRKIKNETPKGSRHYSRWSDEEVGLLIEMRKTGHTKREIAKVLGRTYCSVIGRINRNDRRGARRRGEQCHLRTKWDGELDQMIANLSDQGFTARQIATEIGGVSHRSVICRRSRLGIKYKKQDA